MGRKPRVDRSPEEKWQIVQEGLKSGSVSETCRRYGIAVSSWSVCPSSKRTGRKVSIRRGVRSSRHMPTSHPKDGSRSQGAEAVSTGKTPRLTKRAG